ncbi:MAG: hypothetical protein JWM09_382 [Francisellaceae bacterium]|nr:hypothetical protein [Francisellaceae bacterium]
MIAKLQEGFLKATFSKLIVMNFLLYLLLNNYFYKLILSDFIKNILFNI